MPGNLLNFDFESGMPAGLTDGGGGAPVNYSVIGTDASHGTHCLHTDITSTGSDGGSANNAYCDLGSAVADLYVVLDLKVINQPNAGGVKTKKMFTFWSNNLNHQEGEIEMVDGDYTWIWLFDGGFAQSFSGSIGTIASTLNQWNSWKFHFSHVDGTHNKIQVSFKPFGGAAIDNFFSSTQINAKVGDMTNINFGGPLNENSGHCQYNTDYIRISSGADPGWP